MIDVSHLTKRYPGGILAVENASFSVEGGDVVGLLGPNGAGKSTIMRILSGFVWPSGGEVRIAGMDVTREGMAVRKRIGYLPENCPLYPEMRVGEYLRYRANIKRVSTRHRRKRVERALELCDLGEVQKRLIGKLSKGFRQRVGIADALVHRPDLLILDEPTIGLDPHQIVQIRELIRNLSQEHTVLISSHILSEIETTCNRVVVLYQGRVKDCGTLPELQERWLDHGEYQLEVRADAEEVESALREREGLREVRMIETDDGWTRAEARFMDDADPREDLADLARDREWPLRELSRCEHHLEEAFLTMTREDAEPGGGGA